MWLDEHTGRDSIRIYTDGSVNKKKNGASFTVEQNNLTTYERKIKIGPGVTSYDAEVIAVTEALEWVNKKLHDRVIDAPHISICADNKAAFTAS